MYSNHYSYVAGCVSCERNYCTHDRQHLVIRLSHHLTVSAMKPAALLAVLLPLVLGSRTPLSFSNHPTESDRQRITDVPSNYPFSAVLAADQVTGDPIYQLNWVFDSTQDTITFNVIVKNTGWFGLGLSPDGGMSNSDVVIGWIAADGTVYFHVSAGAYMRNICDCVRESTCPSPIFDAYNNACAFIHRRAQ